MKSEINLLDIIHTIVKYWKSLIIGFVLAVIIAFATAFLLPKTFKAQVTFIPKGNSNSGLLSFIGDAAFGDVLGGSGLSKRQFASLLYSRRLREELVNRLDLIKYYEWDELPNPMDYTLKMLNAGIVEIGVNEEGGLGITDIVSIDITAYDGDPEMAAKIANTMFEILEEFSIELNNKDLEKNVVYLESKITETEKRSDSLTVALMDFQKAHKVYKLPSQVELTIQEYGTLRAALTALDLELENIKREYSANHPEVKSRNIKRQNILNKLNKLETGRDTAVVVGLESSLNLSKEYFDLYANAEAMKKMLIVLQQQYEQAIIKRDKNFSAVILIDNARAPEWKHKPKRAFVIIAIVGIYMFLCIPFVLILDFFKNIDAIDPKSAKKIRSIIEELK